MGFTYDDKVYIMGDIQHATRERETMTNNNHTSPHNCACSRLTCASFVAGNQCFRCEQVDNQRAGITFAAEMDEWRDWFDGNRKREEAHEQSPDYRPASRFNVGAVAGEEW